MFSPRVTTVRHFTISEVLEQISLVFTECSRRHSMPAGACPRIGGGGHDVRDGLRHVIPTKAGIQSLAEASIICSRSLAVSRSSHIAMWHADSSASQIGMS